MKTEDDPLRKAGHRMIDVKWLEDCIQAGEFLYGEFPMSVLKKMYETKCPPVTIADLLKLFWNGS